MKLKVTLVLLFAYLNFPNLFAQNRLDIDSLLMVYQKHSNDTLKVKTINNIVNYYMYRTPKKAKQFAFELLDLSNSLEFKSGQSLGQYQLGVVYNNQDALDSARYYYNGSLKIADQINDGIGKSRAFRGLAILEFSQGNLKQADSINDLDLANTIKQQDSMGIALAYDFKGTINQNQGYYAIALDNVLKGLKLFEQLGDSIRIADSYNHLATLENNLENQELAIRYNKTALKIYEDYNDTYYQAQVLNDIGVMYKVLKQEDLALDYFKQSIVQSKKAGVKAIEVSALTNIGGAHVQLGDYNKAIPYLKESIALAKEINAKRRIAIAQNTLSKAYSELNKPLPSIKAAQEALNYATSNNNLSVAGISNERLSTAYELQGNSKQALRYYKAFKSLNDSLINKEKIKTIEEQRIIFDTEKKEAEIALQQAKIAGLNAQAKNDKLTKRLYGIGLVFLLIILGLIYFGFKQRIKKNAIEREKQEAILKQEIDFKKKELASQTLHLVQKNTFIQELKENLEKIKQSPELFKIEFRRIVMLLKRQSTSDKDWKVFKSYFSEVHNNFDDALRMVSADITEKEIRLASFLRMNLTTKEIASMLNVLPDSVLTSKYRLKKKLNLDKNQDLNAFLNSL